MTIFSSLIVILLSGYAINWGANVIKKKHCRTPWRVLKGDTAVYYGLIWLVIGIGLFISGIFSFLQQI